MLQDVISWPQSTKDCLGALVGDPIGQSENLSNNFTAEPVIETVLSDTSVWQRGDIQFSLVAGCVTLLLTLLVCYLRRPSKPEPLRKLEKANKSLSRLEDCQHSKCEMQAISMVVT